MRKRSETCFLVALALISSALGFSFAGAQQKVARDETPGTKDRFTQNFLAQHEIGRRFRIDPAELPAPKTSAIVTNRALPFTEFLLSPQYRITTRPKAAPSRWAKRAR